MADGGDGGGAAASGKIVRCRTLCHTLCRTGIAPHPRGLVGLLVDSDAPGFMEVALGLMGLVAQHGTPYDPVKGGAPGSGIGGAGDQAVGSGGPAAWAAGGWGGVAPGGGTAGGGGGGGGGGAAGGGGGFAAYAAAAAGESGADGLGSGAPELDHGGIPARRLLMAGGWGSACSCLATAGSMCPVSDWACERQAAWMLGLGKHSRLHQTSW
mgnify:CR=1 FL=1